MFLVYRKVKVIMILSNDILMKLKKFVDETGEAMKPIMQIITIIEAVHKGFDLVSKIIEMKKGGKDNGERTVG